MTNYDKWRSYTDGLISPDNYIDFGWYYLISASLQRRVWVGPTHAPLFPNIYVILVGEPGLGKGIVIKPVSEILKFHKLQDPGVNPKYAAALSGIEKKQIEIVAKDDYEKALEIENGFEKGKDNRNKSYEKPLLFPVAADATTYEALIKSMAKSLRRINYMEKNGDDQEVMKIYSHSSLAFCLEEISSLFRKHTEDTVHFLIQAYDAGDYTYDTKTQGKDRVRRCCLNFFGGTTPGFMQSTFNDQLLTEGFSSRTFFIFATTNRKTAVFIPDLTAEQRQHRQDIIDHVEKLSHLYGKCYISPADMQWLEDWWKEAYKNRPNINPKLNPYYARKQIHVLKLATAIHFGESTEMILTRNDFRSAIDTLAAEEVNMHLALGVDNKNPLSIPAKKILAWLKVSGLKSRKEILLEFYDQLPGGPDDLDEILNHLKMANKIKDKTEENTGRVLFYISPI